jgi:ketosteroid isomerase-like protein
MRTLLAALSLSIACAPRPVTEGPEQAQARIDRESAAAKLVIDSLNAEFDGHFNAGHGALVAAQYAEDGELQVVGSPVLKGRHAIATFIDGLGPLKAAIKLTATSVAANGPIAIERGEYALSLVPPGATTAVSETGVYLIHWHNVNGQWLPVTDVASTAAPAPMGPPPKSN